MITRRRALSWRAELAYRFQAAAATALVLAGLELLSTYLTAGAV